MKKFFLAILLFLVPCSLFLIGCGGVSQDTTPAPDKTSASTEKPASDKKILVAYFSRTGEEYNVGFIKKGNTAVVAEMIAQRTNANIFEIKPEHNYPEEYQACTEVAKTELESDARPKLAANIESVAQYDTIFIGYPIWWGSLPRIVLTFLDSNDFSGKKIIPFCTHGGSGLAGTEREIAHACPNAEVLPGLAIVGRTAHNDKPATEKGVDAWLKTLGY